MRRRVPGEPVLGLSCVCNLYLAASRGSDSPLVPAPLRVPCYNQLAASLQRAGGLKNWDVMAPREGPTRRPHVLVARKVTTQINPLS